MRPLKASCQRLARRHAAEESLTFIGHFPLNFPLNHAAHLYLSSVSMPQFHLPDASIFLRHRLGPSHLRWLKHLLSVRLFSVSVIRRSIRTSPIRLCLLFTSSSYCLLAKLPLLFLHLFLPCPLCPLHYQLTQSADHVAQKADTYHTYQIELCEQQPWPCSFHPQKGNMHSFLIITSKLR